MFNPWPEKNQPVIFLPKSIDQNTGNGRSQNQQPFAVTASPTISCHPTSGAYPDLSEWRLFFIPGADPGEGRRLTSGPVAGTSHCLPDLRNPRNKREVWRGWGSGSEAPVIHYISRCPGANLAR